MHASVTGKCILDGGLILTVEDKSRISRHSSTEYDGWCRSYVPCVMSDACRLQGFQSFSIGMEKLTSLPLDTCIQLLNESVHSEERLSLSRAFSFCSFMEKRSRHQRFNNGFRKKGEQGEDQIHVFYAERNVGKMQMVFGS